MAEIRESGRMDEGRVVFHCDCNNFYASVELIKMPELRGKPVAVSGSVDDRHGIILAKNEIAKQYKVKTAETIWNAKRKCPNLILVSPHHREYKKYSIKINEIYSEYTDRVEQFGIDESWLDLTTTWHLFGTSPEDVADLIRMRIKREMGITISVGVSYNKILSKLASDMRKPDKTTVIRPEDVESVLWPKRVDEMLFIGARAREVLAGIGITTIGELARMDEGVLSDALGKSGRQLRRYANGMDESPVLRIGEQEPVKSIGNSHTYKRDLESQKDVKIAIYSLSDKVAGRLRSKKFYAGGVQLTIKSAELKTITRQCTLNGSTNVSREIAEMAYKLYLDNWNSDKRIRLLGVTATQLTDVPIPIQSSLFENSENCSTKKREKLEKSIDKIRDKYGSGSIVGGSVLHNTMGINATFEAEREENEE